jgi:hypothetical protein
MLPRKKRLVRFLDGATRSVDWDAALPEGAVVVGVSVPAFLKDAEAASFIDGIPAAQDDDGQDAAAAHQAMKARIQNAWKSSPAPQDAPSPGQPARPEAPAATAQEAHDRMKARISGAWRPKGAPEQPRPPTNRNLWV